MQGLSWRNILYAVLGVILPLIYQELIGARPDYPQGESDFVTQVLWLIGLLVGGWNIKATIVNWKVYKKVSKSYAEWIKQ